MIRTYPRSPGRAATALGAIWRDCAGAKMGDMKIQTIFFDLDDTLYPASTGIWPAIAERINRFLSHALDLDPAAVDQLRQLYYERYGTTLRGLQTHHEIDTDAFLSFVHDLPLERSLQPNAALRRLLQELPQHKWVFTNADADHARRVLELLDISDCFDGIIDIRALNFIPKPDPAAFHRARQLAKATASESLVIDDAPRNLAAARNLGFRTVLVGSDQEAQVGEVRVQDLLELPGKLPELLSVPQRAVGRQAGARRENDGS